MNIGPSHGNPGLNVSVNEFFHESTDLFTPPIIERDLEEGDELFYDPIAALNDQSPVEFIVRGNLRDNFDLTATRMHGSFKIVKADGTDLPPEEDVSISNIFPHTLFKLVDVLLNETSVVDSGSALYCYKAFFNVFFSYTKEVKNTMLESTCYYDDDPETRHSFYKIEDSPALKHRNLWIKGSKTVHFVSEIHADIFKCFRLLPPNVDIKVKFIRNDASYGIIAATKDYKVILERLRLSLRKIQTRKELVDTFEAKLVKDNCLLPFTMTKIKTFVIAQGVTSYHQPNVGGVGSRLPRQVIFGLMKTTALSGMPKENIFNFWHYNCSSFFIRINGVNKPYTRFSPDWSNGSFVREYMWLLENTGLGVSNNGVNLSLKSFSHGKTLWAFDLSADLCNGEHNHLQKFGNLDFEIQFKEALPDTIQVVCYLAYDGGVAMNSERQIIPIPI